MKKSLSDTCLISLLVFVLHGCSENTRQYYLKDQWQTSSSRYFPVKNKPKEVQEYFYRGEADILQKNPGKVSSYDLFRYDPEGNLLTRRLFFSDDFWYEFNYVYSNKGYDVVMKAKSTTGLTSKRVIGFEVTSDNIAREKKYDDSLVSDVRIYQYKKGGNEVIKEQTVEGKDFKKDAKTQYWYNGQQILKEIFEIVDEGVKRSSVTTYFYDKNNSLDSFIRVSGEVIERTEFKKNAFGDPVSEICINNRDTITYKTYAYVYDKNKNWIRRQEDDHLPNGFNPTPNVYSLITREIRY